MTLFPSTPAAGVEPMVVLPPRYRDLGRIASGGCGDVRRALDTQFDRVVAVKLLRWEHVASPRMRGRFLVEARATARLEHPGIVAVHERGELPDGRLWFSMKEVRGRTLGDVSDEVHRSAGPGGTGQAPSGWTFRRLVDAFARICQAVAFAHRRGVVHRDLKPDNLMLGDLGEVLVMDWGLARDMGDDDHDVPSPPLPQVARSARITHVGEIMGTPSYMPPEQARGERGGPQSDVYALGAILYCLLAGHAPYHGSAIGVIRQVLAGPPPPVIEAARDGLPVPPELASICDRAMARDPARRHADAAALADGVVAWLDGVERREQARAILARTEGLPAAIAALRARADRHREEAATLLRAVRPFDAVEAKRPGWALEDEAEALMVDAALRETAWLQAVHGALSVDPELSEAHERLSDHYREQVLEAERAQRRADAARCEALLRAHDRGRHAAFLRGEGALSLVTDPPGALVRIERYELRDRRLVPQDRGDLGQTPLHALPLERGSYCLRLTAPGRAEVRYPVLIERGEHWDGCAPGESTPTPIVLPPEGEIGPDEVVVPAGFCWIGGDPGATESLPARRVWIDAFALERFPVTNGAYLEFLNDLVAEGREEEAMAACPRDPPSLSGVSDRDTGRLIYARDARGCFVLAGEEFGRRWREDWPVALVDWHGASAYARWRAARTGRPFRLSSELEREKAARGVDARLFPWGNGADATFACVAESHAELPMRVGVAAYPLDESPYGVRGLAGNIRDWCLSAWRGDGPSLRDGRLALALAPPALDDDFRAVRGGAWTSPLELARSAGRFGNRPTDRRESIGVRLCRSLGSAYEIPVQ
jgi:serine/threonine-protein kinase